MDLGSIEFLLSTNMKYGIGEFKKMPSYIKRMGFTSIAVVVDNFLLNTEYVNSVLSECKNVFKKCEIVSYKLSGEPTYDYLDECVDKMRKHPGLEALVGIGGGSSIDMAKGIAVLMTNKGSGVNYKGFPEGINRPLPVVAVPTTAGSGSDATYNAVFTDVKAERKLGINTTMNFPALAILDPNLISSCPKNVIASSGMDALTHAIESFVSKDSNLITRMFSVEAIKLLIPNLEKTSNYPDDLNTRGYLQLGAYLAGIALFNSSAGPAGALSYMLGTWYKVPHGAAGALFLPHIHRFNIENGYYDYSILYDALNYAKKGLKTEKGKAASVKTSEGK